MEDTSRHAPKTYAELTPAPPKDDPMLDHRAIRSISKRSKRAGCASFLILLGTLLFMIPFLVLFLYSAYHLHTNIYYFIVYAVGGMGTMVGVLTVWAAFQATTSNAKQHVQLTSYARDLEERQRAQHGSLSITVDTEDLHGAMALHHDDEEGDHQGS